MNWIDSLQGWLRTGSLAGLVALVAVFGEASAEGGGEVTEGARREFFEARIRPVLVAHCQECHGAKKQQGGLRLDWREPVLKGGESGAVIEVGRPEESLLVRVIDHSETGLEMPKGAARLPERVVRDFKQWIQDGAYDPRDKAPTDEEAARVEWEAKLSQRRGWWSLRPMVGTAAPVCKDRGWVKDPVDAFVLAKLEAKGLAAAARAERAVLARRLAFVLKGLPPRPEELKAYLTDPAADEVATDRLVERYLESPHFGERWARHWMDVVRYGDTYGYEWDIPAKGAWRYRDYLVRAFNADVPYDQLAREQVAGDLLGTPRVNGSLQINESLIGPMFFQLGEKRHGDSAEFDGIHQEMVHNKIDAFSKAFQAITVGCARCHDHKLDAVSQRDYYALAGAFMSARWVTHTVDTAERNGEVLAKLREIKVRLRKAIGEHWIKQSVEWPREWLASSRKTPQQPDAFSKLVRVEKTKTEAKREDLFTAWVELKKVADEWGDIGAGWSRLAKSYAAERRARVASNSQNFLTVADFRNGMPAGWSMDGVGLRDGPSRAGEFTVALEGGKAVGSILPAGLFTHTLSPRLNGAVRSPYLARWPRSLVSVKSCGGDFSAERIVVDNAFLTERQTYLARSEPGWSMVTGLTGFEGRNVFLEVATKTSNPNFPPRVGLGGACSEAQAADPRSWFGITRVVTHHAPGEPQDELSRFDRLFKGPTPTTLEKVADRYADWLRESLERFTNDTADDDDVIIINGLLDLGLLTNVSDASGGRMVGDLVSEYRRAERGIVEPRTVHGMADVDPGFDYRLNIRGEYDQLGPAVPRGYLGVLAESDSGARFRDAKSGRLELAERVASAANPLTARVYVNRVWQWVFGTGLVATVDDFGRLGAVPSHPELLDTLALEFIEHGWSTKWLVRRLLATSTFQQGNGATARAVEVDPDDRLLHHYPMRRLEAEEIRDAILAVSGRLERRLYGPALDPNRIQEDAMKRLFSGPMDGGGRRSLYVKLTIMEPPRFLATFNQPPPKIPTGRRDVTNTPAQALALLNDPFVIEQAGYWGKRMVAEGRPIRERLERMFLEAVGREPTREELASWRELLMRLAKERGVVEEKLTGDNAVWSDLGHTMMNMKEFLYYR